MLAERRLAQAVSVFHLLACKGRRKMVILTPEVVGSIPTLSLLFW
jgi:hypothetical protein